MRTLFNDKFIVDMDDKEIINEIFKTGNKRFGITIMPKDMYHLYQHNKDIKNIITPELINDDFDKWNLSAQYYLLYHHFDKLNDENKYKGILRLVVNNWRYSGMQFSQRDLSSKVGRLNFDKYHIWLDLQCLNILTINKDMMTEQQFNLLGELLEIYSHSLNPNGYCKYLQFMMQYDPKKIKFSPTHINWLLSSDYFYKIISEYVKTLSDAKLNQLCKYFKECGNFKRLKILANDFEIEKLNRCIMLNEI